LVNLTKYCSKDKDGGKMGIIMVSKDDENTNQMIYLRNVLVTVNKNTTIGDISALRLYYDE